VKKSVHSFGSALELSFRRRCNFLFFTFPSYKMLTLCSRREAAIY